MAPPEPFPEDLMKHYGAIIAPGLPAEAMAEGLAALNLCNTPGSMIEGRKKLAAWYEQHGVVPKPQS